ncbi:MAG: urease accessory protein UreD [Gammaproteobacteria bacterium]|nr:urease accessory protein UreD [Gammaproteobacteria bacterium]
MQRAFYPEDDVCHVYLLHPPGGVAGGDSLALNVNVGHDAHALITTPGATRFYRSKGKPALLDQQLRVTGGALEWFPQDTLYFSGSNARGSTGIFLDATAKFVGWDIQCFGRPASNALFTTGSFTNRVALYRDKVPVFADRLQVANAADLLQRTGVRGHLVNAMMLVTPASSTMLDIVREQLPAAQPTTSSVTLLPDLLVIRYLGDCAETARDLFVRLWASLRPWLLERPACNPRIWAT